jgi:hypothetical protein
MTGHDCTGCGAKGCPHCEEDKKVVTLVRFYNSDEFTGDPEQDCDIFRGYFIGPKFTKDDYEAIKSLIDPVIESADGCDDEMCDRCTKIITNYLKEHGFEVIEVSIGEADFDLFGM